MDSVDINLDELQLDICLTDKTERKHIQLKLNTGTPEIEIYSKLTKEIIHRTRTSYDSIVFS